MGIAALILGIVAIIISFLPFCSYVGLIPAIVGIVLGIVSIVDKNEIVDPNNKALSIVGIVFCGIAIVLNILWSIILLGSMMYAV